MNSENLSKIYIIETKMVSLTLRSLGREENPPRIRRAKPE
jgi:hypothetical protein